MPSAQDAGRAFSPLDEELALLPGTLAPRLVESVARLGTWMPFERVPEALAFFTGVRISVETVRRLTEHAGAALVAVEEQGAAQVEREAPPAPVGPAVQQLSADGAMVPLVGGGWTEVKTLAVGTVVPAPPNEDGVVARTVDLSYFSRLAEAERFSHLALVETQRRGTETAGVVCAVMDGAEWLQSFIDLHRPDAVRILDFPHAAEHVSAAAHAVFEQGTPAAREWLGRQLHDLKHGDPDRVIVAVAALPVERAASPADATVVREATVNYLTKRRPQLAYATFRAAGYPIGSGMVESANKLVVEARLKGSGMHWARPSVNPMVALRAAACSDRWAATWPAIWQHRRAQCSASRAQRRAARHPRLAATPDPPCALQPPAPTVPLRSSTSCTPLVVNGRPTAQHPWKRPALAGGRVHNARHAKS